MLTNTLRRRGRDQGGFGGSRAILGSSVPETRPTPCASVRTGGLMMSADGRMRSMRPQSAAWRGPSLSGKCRRKTAPGLPSRNSMRAPCARSTSRTMQRPSPAPVPPPPARWKASKTCSYATTSPSLRCTHAACSAASRFVGSSASAASYHAPASRNRLATFRRWPNCRCRSASSGASRKASP